MIVRRHFIYGIIFSALLFLIFPVKVGWLGAIIIFASSFFIDTDHYIYSVFKEKSISPRKIVKYFVNAREKYFKMLPEKRKEYYSAWCFLHGVESLIVLFVLGTFVHRYFHFILIGVAFHLILDWAEEIYFRVRIDKVSLIYDYFKYKKLKRL